MLYFQIALAKFFAWFKFKSPVTFMLFSLAVAGGGPALTKAIELQWLPSSPVLSYTIQSLIFLTGVIMGTQTSNIIEKEEDRKVKTEAPKILQIFTNKDK